MECLPAAIARGCGLLSRETAWYGGVPYKSKISVSVTVLCVCACACVYVCVLHVCMCV